MRKLADNEVPMSQPAIAKELLEILVCPACHAALQMLEYKPGEYGLKCSACHGVFPIRDNIPVMLIEEMIRES